MVRREEQDIRERIGTNRYKSICGIRQIYGRTIAMLSPEEAFSTLQEVNAILLREAYREKNNSGMPGALLEPPEELTLLVVGDLHAQVDNFLKILTENCLLSHLAANSACLVILGDAVHSEIPKEMEDMDNSILILDLIFKMKCQFQKISSISLAIMIVLVQRSVKTGSHKGC